MLVTPDDVRDRWVGGDLDFTDQTIGTLIEDSEDAIRASVPEVDQLVGGAIPIGRVARVISRMVIRVLRNPEGIRTLQETTGQFSGSTTYAGDVLGEIVFTDEDRRDLLGKGPTGRRAYSTMPGGIR